MILTRSAFSRIAVITATFPITLIRRSRARITTLCDHPDLARIRSPTGPAGPVDLGLP